MGTRLCPVCSTEVADDVPMVRALVWHRRNRRSPRWKRREPVCQECAAKGHAVSRDELTDVWGGREWRGVEPVECVECGQLVILPPDKRLTIRACSDLCRLRYHRHNRPVPTAVTRSCDGCGQPMEGRADRRYCSPACRQRAYRQRVTG